MNMSILAALPGFALAFILIFCYEYRIKLIKTKPKNNVHFYVARDKYGSLSLYLGKPFRDNVEFCGSVNKGIVTLANSCHFNRFGLNETDYDNLTWEDEPVEVLLNIKD